MQSYLPASNPHALHHRKDYFIVLFSLTFITIAVNYDGSGSLADQKILAVMAWTFLISMLWGEDKNTRMQVILTLIFATMAEHFAALYMECYSYRFKNLPSYVPPGHGVVYMAIVALARSGFFQRYARKIAIFAVMTGGTWALWGIIADRQDLTGTVLFCIFLAYFFKGRAPMIYLGAFFISTWLEIVGTFSGTWAWAEIDPIFGLTQGNPPSGVAACYCFVDYLGIITTKLAVNKWTYFWKELRFKIAS